MAISYTSGEIQVTYGYDYGTATSGSSTTLVDTGKSWTTDVMIGRLVWIKAGTRQHAVGYVTSNTSTTLTCSGGFFRFNTTSKAYETVNPASGDTYAICYKMSDIISAVPSYASWAITSKDANVTASIHLMTSAALQCMDEVWTFTTDRTVLYSDTGTFFQSGRPINTTFPYDGAAGGSLFFRLASGTDNLYWEVTQQGKCKFYNTLLHTHREISDSLNIYHRWNYPAATIDGLEFYRTSVFGILAQMCSGKDIYVNTDSTLSVSIDSQPLLFSGNRFSVGPRSSASFGELGSRGADIIDHTQLNLLWLYLYYLSGGGVAYFWNPTMYTSDWTSIWRWYGNVGDGHIYRGYLVALDIKDSGGTGLSGVVAYVAKTSDGSGAILTGKAGDYTPTVSATVSTTSGSYTGIVGSSEGMPVLYAKYLKSSEYVSSETLYGPYTFRLRKYGYQFISRSANWTRRTTEAVTLATNTYVSASEATAGAYTGVSINGSAKSITLSGARTVQELYDYSQYWAAQSSNAGYDEPITTTDGVTFTLTSGWTITGLSNLTFGSDVLAGGTIILSSAGTYTLALGITTVRFSSAGTYVMSATDFNGHVTFTNTSGGSVTVEIPGGVSYTNSGPSITVSGPQVYQSVTISGAVAGTRLQIYDTTHSTELYNGTPTFPYTWTDASPYSSDRAIRIRAMYVSGVTAKLFVEANIGTATLADPDLSYLISQSDDSVYITNGINGSTITDITIDDTGLLVNVDTGNVTWQDLYAYETYWLGTTTGIRDEGRFTVAPDVANYVWYDFKIKNITSPSVPLVITGGYGVDSATGAAIDLIDTSGGTIFCAPDHVVAKIVTTTGDNVITGDIDDVTAKVQAGLTAQGYTTARASKIDATLSLGTFIALK